MRIHSSRTTAVLMAGTALTLSACGGQADTAADEQALNEIAIETLYEPGNDMTAMEAVANDMQAETGPADLPSPEAGSGNMAAVAADIVDTDSGPDAGTDSDIEGM